MNLVNIKQGKFFYTIHYIFLLLGRKVKGLERQLKEKDMHYRLKWIEDMKQIRDQVKAETNITLRDYESRHYD